MSLSLIRNFIQLIWARYTANNLAYQSVSDLYQPVSRAYRPYLFFDNAKVQRKKVHSKFSVQNPPFLMGIFRLNFANNSKVKNPYYALYRISDGYFGNFIVFWEALNYLKTAIRHKQEWKKELETEFKGKDVNVVFLWYV